MRKDFNNKIHNSETQNIIRSLKRENRCVRVIGKRETHRSVFT